MLYPDFNELVRMGGDKARLGDISGRRPVLAAASGNYTSPFRGQGLTFHEVREYRPGDDIRSIDWRVTARTNKAHMKVFTEDRERTVMLCVDANAAMRFGTRGTFKSVQAARVTAWLGWQANGSNDRIGCLLYGDVPDGMQIFRPSRSRRSLWQALKLLSAKETGKYKDYVPVETMLRRLDRLAPAGSLIFIIGDFAHVPESLEQCFSSLQRRCDIVLVRIDDPADGIIPPVGAIRFCDMRGQEIVIDTDSRPGQEAYSRLWQENRNRLEDICMRRGIGMLNLATNGDVRRDLMPGLRRLALGRH